jgi:hypothetical protein
MEGKNHKEHTKKTHDNIYIYKIHNLIYKRNTSQMIFNDIIFKN